MTTPPRMLVLFLCSAVALAGCGGRDGVTVEPSAASAGPCEEEIAQLEEAVRESAARIHVYPEDGPTREEARRLTREMREIEGVRDVAYVSRRDALEQARELFAGSPEILDNLTSNPFPAQFELKVDPDRISEIAAELESLTESAEVQRGDADHRRVIQRYRQGDQLAVCRSLQLAGEAPTEPSAPGAVP